MDTLLAGTTKQRQNPAEALENWLARLQPVGTEVVALSAAGGRVLAEPLEADRDSPPSSVSAMDGYAVRLEPLPTGAIPVHGTVAIGEPPSALPPGAAMRIFTGACVPTGTEAVIRREEVRECVDSVQLLIDPASIKPGENIRYRGENRRAGETVIAERRRIDGPVASAMAAFGMNGPRVFRKVRVGLLITGDELLPVESVPEPWQLRDSNGPALHGMFAHLPWLEIVRTIRVSDALPATTSALGQLLAGCDAVFITGGVSMGDRDYVPAAVRETGCEVVFHKLPIRPGKPLLAGIGPGGQAVLGLPGNPVSVMVAARRFGVPVLRKLAGYAQPDPPQSLVRLMDPAGQPLKLWWYRPVRMVGMGEAEFVPNMGSGDMAGTAQSEGFVEIAPGGSMPEMAPYWPWTVS